MLGPHILFDTLSNTFSFCSSISLETKCVINIFLNFVNILNTEKYELYHIAPVRSSYVLVVCCTYNEDHADDDCSFLKRAATAALPQPHGHLVPHNISL
jgi:hypothetical protein